MDNLRLLLQFWPLNARFVFSLLVVILLVRSYLLRRQRHVLR